MRTELKIDFVSDVACPWCAIGLGALERALEQSRDVLNATIRFQPFELNPAMGPEGEDVTEHLQRKYGSTPEQQAAARARIRQLGAAVGFEFHPGGRGRIHNTFDAHRLLAWAGEAAPDRQRDLKRALLEAYHGRAESPADRQVLLHAAEAAGLDGQRAAEVLDQGLYADEVRERERFYAQAGVHAVPAVIIEDRYLISGGQPPEVFEQALRRIAAEAP